MNPFSYNSPFLKACRLLLCFVVYYFLQSIYKKGFMDIISNPVFISVILMCILCLLKINILIAIMVSAVVAGTMSGFELNKTMDLLINGMGGQTNTALSYILLGGLAVAIAQTGLATILSNKLERIVGKKAKIFLLILAAVACLSQNLIPVHIAFIPILIPPLLSMMNDLKLDRRAAACSLTFGLKAPYVALPVGFGLIFHGVIADNIKLNGLHVETLDVWKYVMIPALSMVAGLLVAIFITYRKPRDYQHLPITVKQDTEQTVTDKFTLQHLGAALGAISAFAIQLMTGSLPLGALIGLTIMVCFKAILLNEQDNIIFEGIRMMGFIAFVMLVASGFGNVLRETGGVDSIVQASTALVGGSQFFGALVMLLIGLIVTMGIGTSFGTIPIIATIYVPFSAALGLSVGATVMLIAVAGALGDAGSPASDSTLGPTAGLNADGQHDHIWDTCVPTFIHYNIPLIIAGLIAAMFL